MLIFRRQLANAHKQAAKNQSSGVLEKKADRMIKNDILFRSASLRR
jgi:hypothetical protein